jgi:hypothetical protein
MGINWVTVTNNIRNSGQNLSSAATIIGCEWQHLNRLARGEVKEPRFNTGLKILDLHLALCPEKHTIENISND